MYYTFFAKQLEVITQQQDGAPSHRSIHKIAFLQKNVADFLLNRQTVKLAT